MKPEERRSLESRLLDAIVAQHSRLETCPHVLGLGLGVERGPGRAGPNYILKVFVDDDAHRDCPRPGRGLPESVPLYLGESLFGHLPVRVEAVGLLRAE